PTCREGCLKQSDGQEVVTDEVVVVDIELGIRSLRGADLNTVVVVGDSRAVHLDLHRRAVERVGHDATTEVVVTGHPGDVKGGIRGVSNSEQQPTPQHTGVKSTTGDTNGRRR